MIQILVRKGEPIERAIHRFKKKYEKAGILRDIKRNIYYIKPSQYRRMKRSKAEKRARRTAFTGR